MAAAQIPVSPKAPAGLAYGTNPAFYTVGVPIPHNVPTSTGGAVISYSVVPDLPSGLNLSKTPILPLGDAATGIISGTPKTAAATSNYIITATNAAGFTKATLTLTVNAAQILSMACASITSSGRESWATSLILPDRMDRTCAKTARSCWLITGGL